MSRHRRAPAYPAAALILIHFAAASARAGEPAPLRLDEVVAAVRKNNPAIAERRHLGEAAARRPGAVQPEDPTVSLDWWQQPVDFATVPLMLSVRQPIPWSSKLGLRREVAAAEARVAGRDTDELERRLVADAKRAYFDLALAERSLAINDRMRALGQHIVEITDALYRVGKAAQPDLFRAQSELLVVDNERLDLERARDEAAARLNALLDRPPETPVGATVTPLGVVALPSEAELVARALADRPDVRRAQAMLGAAESRRALANKERLPEVAVSAGYMLNVRGVDMFTVGVSTTLPIFGARRAHALDDVGTAEIAAARSALDAARRQCALDVHLALLQLETASRHVRLHADKLVPLADVSLESAEASYRSGRVGFLTVLDAARVVRQHHLDHQRFLADYRRRLADLEQALGSDLDMGDAS